MTPRCADCRYFDMNRRHPDARFRAACRRAPPLADGDGTHWPVVHEEEYCGEFVGRETDESTAKTSSGYIHLAVLLSAVVIALVIF